MIGDCKRYADQEGFCAGNPNNQAVLIRHNRPPYKFSHCRDGLYFWTHGPKGFGGGYWYCRECHEQLLFRKLKQGEIK